MIQKLKAKGYIYKQADDVLTGEFNGTDVILNIGTNNNKVYRIMLMDKNYQDEANIKIRFNTLVKQFENNKHYTSLEEQTIADDVDISYEMNVNNKIFEAQFYQNLDMEKVDTLELQEQLYQQLSNKYTKEQLQNPTEDMATDLAAATIKLYSEILSKKPVWFRIMEHYGMFYIVMYYDNEWNHANGEDL